MLDLIQTPHRPAILRSRLSHGSLARLPRGVRRPGYDPARLGRGILHLGCGAFHRGHQALATQRAIEAEGTAGLRWGIASASMRRPEAAALLAPQDGLYTLIERQRSGPRAEIIGSIREVLHAPSDRRGLPARIADPETRIVTLTVTAAGYLLHPATHRLDANHPDIRHDLGAPARPRSAIGALAAGLARVRARGGRPPAILSCDNVAANGRTLRRAVADFAALHDDGLATWIEAAVPFPNSMVDRIVPVPDEADRADAHRLTGLEDAAALSAEPFLQWMIEDFSGDRPHWEAAGARFVPDVAPFEQAKLRLLNGTHMLLAYLGALADHDTIAETMADPQLRDLARDFMREQGATLAMPPAEREAYVETLLQRLGNPAIRHEVARIARNGSAKMATRMIAPMRENLEAGRATPGAVLAIAAWIRCFALRDTSGTTVQAIDPRREALRALCERVGEDHPRLAREFLAQDAIFGPELPRHDAVVRDLGRALRALHRHPLHEAVRQL